MKVGVLPETWLERLALSLGLLPTPFVESWFTFILARALLVANKLGLFDTLAAGPLTAAEVAEHCRTHPHATAKLLTALLGAGYVRQQGDRYALAPVARRWLLRDSPQSFHDRLLAQLMEWDWWSHCEEFLRTGEPLHIHDRMTEEEWGIYQRGLRSGIEFLADWVARHLPVPPHGRDLLDLGGGHGYWSVAVCRRHPGLRATVLDLPRAVRPAAAILAREGMGDRVVHREGDALADDLGTAAWDVVFLSFFVDNFDADQNRDVLRRVARALRPGGVAAVWEHLARDASGRVNQAGGLMDLFFSLCGRAGAWTLEEITGWQREAGLRPRPPLRPPAAPNMVLQVAVRDS
jgi:SAM-dependent methyltransferase